MKNQAQEIQILLVAASLIEIKPFLKKMGVQNYQKENERSFNYKNVQIDILITGIGLVFTSFHLTKALTEKKYDLIINAGIAGSFNPELPIGEIVFVIQEAFSDLGIEGTDSFKTLFETGFMNNNEFPFINGKLHCSIPEKLKENEIKRVNGISSNTAHGNEKTIDELVKKFNPDIETMEGAAFFYVCLMEKVKFIELRAISNYVEKRDKSKWNIPLAVENLSEKIMQIIHNLADSF